MTQTIKLADYLFTRLRQLGVSAVHGVPGDYNLVLLDYVEPSGLFWVGNANELNAGYAADGYARIKGVGALITTFGVGELSAINAIACAYTERAAVVHIVGTPSRESQESRLNIHHTLGDGDYRHFSQMHSHVTVAQTNLLDPRTAPQQIDEVLGKCILHSRPVYIEVPQDMVAVQVLSERLATEIKIAEAVPDPSQDAVLAKVIDRIYAAKNPIILVDGETRSLGLTESVQNLIRSTNWPTYTTSFGRSLVDETSTNMKGIYCGDFADSATKSLWQSADLVLCFGPHFSSTNSYGLTSIPKAEITISFSEAGIRIFNEMHRGISAKYAVSQLLQMLDHSKLQTHEVNGDSSLKSLPLPANVSNEEEIKHDKFWKMLSEFVRPGDILLGETGTASYGVREIALPQHTRLFTSVTWLSIGYMLPAAQGASLAQRELMRESKYHDIKDARTILFIGDGSFQMTVQELGTIIRHHLNVIIVLLNNNGYTIERCIHGLGQGYNDIAAWQYLKAPGFFGASKDVYTGSARTYGELKQVLSNESLANGKGLRMVEVFMDQEDAPAGPLLDLLNKQRAHKT